MAIEPIDTKLIDALLAGHKKPEDIIGKNGRFVPVPAQKVQLP